MSQNTSIKFIHFRYPESNGGFKSRGGRTVAYQELSPGEFRVALSKCHYNDNFNKRLARVRATGRLNSVSEAQTFKGTYDELLQAATHEAAQYGLVRKFANKPKDLPASQTGLVATI